MNTKKAITDAFVKILHETPFNKITIQMILDESEVGRSTFYRHFKDKHEVMTWYYQAHAKELEILYGYENYDKILEELAQFLKDNKTYFEKVINITGQNSFSDFLEQSDIEFFVEGYKKHHNKDVLSRKEEYQIKMAVEGQITALKQYVINGCSEDPHVAAEWTYEMLPDFLKVK